MLQKSVARCLRACLVLLLLLVSFADGKQREEYVQLPWSTVLKILLCLILCSVADVAKTLLAKLLSSHFHKRAHFDKMQDALNKVQGFSFDLGPEHCVFQACGARHKQSFAVVCLVVPKDFFTNKERGGQTRECSRFAVIAQGAAGRSTRVMLF